MLEETTETRANKKEKLPFLRTLSDAGKISREQLELEFRAANIDYETISLIL